MTRTTMAFGTAATVALLALGGCGKKGEDTTSVALVKPAAPAAPMTPPSRKAGLWEQKISTAGMNQTMKMCLDEAVEQKMKWWGSQAQNNKTDCAEQSITPHAGGGWDFHAVCKMGESGTITSDGSATGDFGSHYKVEVTSVTSGSPMAQANGTHKTTIEATWTGPCPAGMKGGDMQMPNGMVFNASDAMSGKPPSMPGGAGGGSDMAKLRAEAMSGHMDPATIAKMRAQANAMEAAAKQSQ